MYLYFADAQVHTITLLNHLCLFILYNILLRPLINLKTSSSTFIKRQAFKFKLIDTWDSFKYRKNITDKRI